MYSRAAFVSTSRAAAASSPPAYVDLSLTSPNCPRPVTCKGDLSVTSRPLPQAVLTPASSLSSDREAFHRELFATLQSAVTRSFETGTVRTYEATLRVIDPNVSTKLGTQVLPMASAAQFFSFFGSA